MMRQTWASMGLVSALALNGVACFADQETILSVSGNRVEAGGIFPISILVVDASKKTAKMPEKIEGAFTKGGVQYAVVLKKAGGDLSADMASSEGAIRRYSYQMSVPEHLPAGVAELSLPSPFHSALLLTVEAPLAERIEVAKERTVAETVEKALDDHEGESSLGGGLDTYHPIYFIGGSSPTDAKFEISLKYQLFNDYGKWAQAHTWLTGFHIGYTQVSFWNLSEESKPFEDTNFMPEFFYGIEGLHFGFMPLEDELDVQTGFLHESNGRGGDYSRSLNMIYSRASYKHMLTDKLFARLTGDIWTYIGSLSDNPDLTDYRGHSSLGLIVGSDTGVQLSSYHRGKFGSEKGSFLFDLTVPLKWEGIAKNLNFSLHTQLFTGYGENLLTYNEKETRLRIGLGLSR